MQLSLGPGDTPLFTGSLYRTDDQGDFWQRIDHGLPRRGVQEAVVSPGFAADQTLFAAARRAGLFAPPMEDRPGNAWAAIHQRRRLPSN
jgi:photosystem II stability/assembly factor-like uncharacterized protein